MNTQDFGKFVAELRKEKSMTQLQLAEKLNVTDKAVSHELVPAGKAGIEASGGIGVKVLGLSEILRKTQ